MIRRARVRLAKNVVGRSLQFHDDFGRCHRQGLARSDISAWAPETVIAVSARAKVPGESMAGEVVELSVCHQDGPRARDDKPVRAGRPRRAQGTSRSVSPDRRRFPSTAVARRYARGCP